MLPKFFLINSSRTTSTASGTSTVSTVSTDSGPSTTTPTRSTSSLSSPNPSAPPPPAIKPRLPTAPLGRYRLPPSILPPHSHPSQNPKYRQPPSALIPYPRSQVDIIEAIKQRRDDIPELTKWDYEVRAEVKRVETVGGRLKRGWEKVVFWEKKPKGGEDEDDYD